MKNQISYMIALTAATVIAGEIRRAGFVASVPGDLSDDDAKNLLHRGKAEIHTAPAYEAQAPAAEAAGTVVPASADPEIHTAPAYEAADHRKPRK